MVSFWGGEGGYGLYTHAASYEKEMIYRPLSSGGWWWWPYEAPADADFEF